MSDGRLQCGTRVYGYGWSCLLIGFASPAFGTVLGAVTTGGSVHGTFGLILFLTWVVVPTASFLLGLVLSAYGVLRRNPRFGTWASFGLNLGCASLLLGYIWGSVS